MPKEGKTIKELNKYEWAFLLYLIKNRILDIYEDKDLEEPFREKHIEFLEELECKLEKILCQKKKK